MSLNAVSAPVSNIAFPMLGKKAAEDDKETATKSKTDMSGKPSAAMMKKINSITAPAKVAPAAKTDPRQVHRRHHHELGVDFGVGGWERTHLFIYCRYRCRKQECIFCYDLVI
jgi:hypothetical protein